MMEARSRNLGVGFPCFPKATRSIRGRADHSVRRPSEGRDAPQKSCFFELLATVAGQLLQQQDERAIAARSLVDLESPKVSFECLHDTGTAYNASSCLRQGSDAAIQIKEEDMVNVAKDSEHARDVSDEGYEPFVANVCLEKKSDSVSGQKQNTKPLEVSAKAHSTRNQKMGGALSCQWSATASRISRNIKRALRGRSNHRSSIVKRAFLQQMYSCSTDLQEPISVDKQGGVAGQHCKDQCQKIDLLAPFQGVNSPPLVSSGSNEETAPLELDSYSTAAFESAGQDAVREEFPCRKLDDDDDNSSGSTVWKRLLTKSSSMSYTRTIKPCRYTHSTSRRKILGVGSKRKCQVIEDGEQSRNRKAQLGEEKSSKLSLPSHDNEQLKNSSLAVLVDTSREEKSISRPLHSVRQKCSGELFSDSPTIKPDDSNVKLSIQSFMVPELMVVLPESATVANLKKAVMEAAMNLLGGGLCVRVYLQGQKVTDETESLLQAGISGSGKSDSLGFMLEPNPFPASCGADDSFLVLSHNGNQTLSRYPVVSKASEIKSGNYIVGTSEGLLDIDDNSSGTEMQLTNVSLNKDDVLAKESNGFVLPPAGGCALVLHATQMNSSSNELAVVPFGPISGAVGMSKRRIRRPFSVAEVEVLVQAVETLGTGRWRDVKLQAFAQAKHRTYVDLKDKWKTLVHTASIASHQRRGEPVPQGLLDRVIQAHSYWTAQQAKQQSREA